MEALTAATKTGAQAMMMAGQTGEIQQGFLADMVAVEGDPTADVRVLQDKAKLRMVMKDGVIHSGH
jgi:imidazolonepropionase-like amidohydrolase